MKSTKIPFKLTGLSLLGVILAVVIGYFALAAQVEERRHPMGKLRAADLVSIEIERGAERIVLEGRRGRWRLSEPFSDEADREAVSGLLGALFRLKIGKAVAQAPESYPGYGLAESRVRLRVMAEGRKKPSFDGNFGGEVLGSDTHYFRFARGKPVYVASGIETSQLGVSVGSLRERRLLALEPGEIASLDAWGGGGTYAYRGSTGAAAGEDAFVSRVRDLRAADFASEETGEREGGFEAPLLTVWAKGAEGRVKVDVGGPCPEAEGRQPRYRYARVEGRQAVLMVPAGDVEALLPMLH